MNVDRLTPILFLAACLQLTASSIDITGQPFFTVPSGRDVTIHFGVWNYGRNNPDVSPYPTTVGLLAMGLYPSGYALANLPDTTQSYFPDFLFEGWLEALDGSISIPFQDSGATRLGFGPGILLATPGTISFGGGAPVPDITLTGSVSFSLATSQALFGSNIGNYNNAAVIRLRNLGQPLTLGLGAAYPVGSSIWEPGIRGLGATQTSGITGPVVIPNPEPSTGLMLAGALGLIGLVRGFKKRRS